MNKMFISIAKRENNTKRGYLIVNPTQGKHIPVSPSVSLSVFSDLAKKIEGKYENERILFIGFAETATAIGAQVAVTTGMPYIQTTREIIPDVEYIFFSEEHSHATEQKLVKTDLDSVIENIDRIIFVEDEVSTGKTILNIINMLQKIYEKKFRFSVMSILNGMTPEDMEKYSGIDIEFLYLEKIDRSSFEKIAAQFEIKGEENPCDLSPADYSVVSISGYMNARRLVDSNQYLKSCSDFADKIIQTQNIASGKKILVLGTEEFMYPAIFAGKKIEELGNTVRTHSTTRSPISVYSEENYPLHSRFQLASLYDPARTTYLYNLDHYDKVLIVTDSALENPEGISSLINAVKKFSKDITVIRWIK